MNEFNEVVKENVDGTVPSPQEQPKEEVREDKDTSESAVSQEATSEVF